MIVCAQARQQGRAALVSGGGGVGDDGDPQDVDGVPGHVARNLLVERRSIRGKEELEKMYQQPVVGDDGVHYFVRYVLPPRPLVDVVQVWRSGPRVEGGSQSTQQLNRGPVERMVADGVDDQLAG